MVKCYNCGQTNDKIDTPRLCPECGHIMKPVKKIKKILEENNVSRKRR